MFELTLQQLNTLALALSLISAGACYLNIKKKKECFIVWSFTNVGFIILNLISGLLGQIPMWVVFTALNIYGYREWSKEE